MLLLLLGDAPQTGFTPLLLQALTEARLCQQLPLRRGLGGTRSRAGGAVVFHFDALGPSLLTSTDRDAVNLRSGR